MTDLMLDTAKKALERFHEVRVDDDGALSFLHGEVPCALQGVELSEGLQVLSLTCVVAWDLPTDSDIPIRLAERAGQGMFGTLGAVRTNRGWDVTLRYVFPATGLDVEPMGTLLMLVVSTASQVRTELLTGANA
ncbi:MAG TPA: hypothetical protein VGM60_18050 [Pseudonocardia sp.]|jgi:hypothetical protein|uniref:hypothetical protein n=1 Tax=Pseudonocardia sp. TaxID=60912 RepID=UPI002F3E8F08